MRHLCLGTWLCWRVIPSLAAYSHFISGIIPSEALRPPGNSTTFFQSVNSSACPVITVTSHISIIYLPNNHSVIWMIFPFYLKKKKNSCNRKKTSPSSHINTQSPELHLCQGPLHFSGFYVRTLHILKASTSTMPSHPFKYLSHSPTFPLSVRLFPLTDKHVGILPILSKTAWFDRSLCLLFSILIMVVVTWIYTCVTIQRTVCQRKKWCVTLKITKTWLILMSKMRVSIKGALIQDVLHMLQPSHIVHNNKGKNAIHSSNKNFKIPWNELKNYVNHLPTL